MTKKDQDNLARLYLESSGEDNPYGYDDETGEYDSAQSLQDNIEYFLNEVKSRKFEDALSTLQMIENDLQRELHTQINITGR
jgi:hypothetical protein